MFWRILPHLSACFASGRLLLLDVRRDRYLRVPEATLPSFRQWLEQGGEAPEAVLRLLRLSGVLGPADTIAGVPTGEAVSVPKELVPPIWRRSLDQPVPALLLSKLLAANRARLRFRRLENVLGRVRGAEEQTSEDIETLTRQFERGRPLAPFRRNCLLDSLTLLDWLGAHARECRLVLGVTAEPFRAHCWVQSEATVLNDSYDQVARFAPILAI